MCGLLRKWSCLCDHIIALLRGINVGGNNKMPMADLRAMLEGLGFVGVQTYIQSGNAIFAGEGAAGDLQAKIEAAITTKFGFSVPVMVVSADDLNAAIAANPFVDVIDNPAKSHLGFMSAAPTADAIALLKTKPHSGEQWKVRGRIFYLHTPQGMGTSKLFPAIERTLKVAVTFRNWRTVEVLAGMAGG